jgi:hypothetical protein
VTLGLSRHLAVSRPTRRSAPSVSSATHTKLRLIPHPHRPRNWPERRCGKCGMVSGCTVPDSERGQPQMNSTEGIDPDGVTLRARSRSKYPAPGRCAQARRMKLIARDRPYFNAYARVRGRPPGRPAPREYRWPTRGSSAGVERGMADGGVGRGPGVRPTRFVRPACTANAPSFVRRAPPHRFRRAVRIPDDPP